MSIFWFEPTDFRKATKIFQCKSEWQKVLHFVSPNLNELIEIANYFQISIPTEESKYKIENIKKISQHLIQWIPVIIVTLGVHGVMVTRKGLENEPFYDKDNNLLETADIQSHLYPPLSFENKIVSVSGCGDCLAAGIIAGILQGMKESTCISLGLCAANQSLASFETVPNSLKLLSV